MWSPLLRIYLTKNQLDCPGTRKFSQYRQVIQTTGSLGSQTQKQIIRETDYDKKLMLETFEQTDPLITVK